MPSGPAINGFVQRVLANAKGVEHRHDTSQKTLENCITAPADVLKKLRRVFADGGYAGDRVTTATRIIVEIVAKRPGQIGFVLLPRRWVVERFFAWIGRNHRLAKDFEATIASARGFLYAASIMLLSRRIARAT